MERRTIKEAIDETTGMLLQQSLFVIQGLIEFKQHVKALKFAAENLDDDDLDDVMFEIAWRSYPIDELALARGVESPNESGLTDLETVASNMVDMTLDQKDREYTSQLLTRYSWNKSHVCRILDIERSTLDRKLARWGVKRPS